MHRWQGGWWKFNGQVYRRMEEGQIDGLVTEWLDRSMKAKEEGTVKFRPTGKQVDEIVKFLRTTVLPLDAEVIPVRWLDSGERAGDVMAFRNAVVNLRTGEVTAHTPRLWLHGAVGYDWNPDLRCPLWERQLETMRPGDTDSQMTLEEFGGLALTEDIRFKKGLMLIGEPDSGKSLLAKLFEAMLGSGLYVGLDFATLWSKPSGLQCLLGKRLGCFPDVRLPAGQMFGKFSYKPGGLDKRSIELLLKVIGGDAVPVPINYEEAFNGVLSIKFMLISNVVPALNDETLATNRFVNLRADVSIPREEQDVNLVDKLKVELPGVVGRFVQGYHRLLARGRFLQPASGLELAEELIEKTIVGGTENVFDRFFSECCGWNAGATVEKGEVRDRFRQWCQNNAFGELAQETTPQAITREAQRYATEHGYAFRDTNLATAIPSPANHRPVGMVASV